VKVRLSDDRVVEVSGGDTLKQIMQKYQKYLVKDAIVARV
jgi:hypothetical protein